MAAKSLNILITAASRRVALIRGFMSALDKLGVAGNVVTTDVNPLSPGLYVSHRHHFAPLTTDPGYIPRIKEICELEQIGLIIPTIDDELELMGTVREEFAALGVLIVISPAKTSRICNDKWEAFRFFTRAGIPTPYTWLARSVPPGETLKFPLFIKPRRGRGSVNTFHLRNARDLSFFTTYVKDAIVQQYLEGPEYTLDTLLDLNGTVISVVPRRRLWVRSGVMDKGVTEKKFELIDLAIEVATKLEAIGPINIQAKYSGDKPYVIEVNPRFSGGIPLTLAAGCDFPEWICRMALGETIEPRLGEFTPGVVMMSYEESVMRIIDPDWRPDLGAKLI